ncbi:MAG: type II toxin-antitoxin system VapC family toxin [Xanthobacteraceae bacterium]|nr:type II toxin-antitoxin system VapC family toxin [Xanthobacteraceae bacterium]
MSGITENQPPAIFYLDSMTFIFAIEGVPAVSEPARALLSALQKNPGVGITSELTLAEVLAGSEHGLEADIKRAYLDLMVWSKFLDLIPINRTILYDSAKLRHVHKRTHDKKLRLPDAIHLATAIQARCRYFVSHDEGIKPPADMKKVAFDRSAIDEALKVLA